MNFLRGTLVRLHKSSVRLQAAAARKVRSFGVRVSDDWEEQVTVTR